VTLQLLHQGIAATAATAPDRIAVVDGPRQLSYAELDRRTDQVAALLAGLGVAPGHRVCFWLEKSIEAVVALYGILKAGAAYVPLDPKAPVARVAGIAADCSPTALLSTRDKAAGWADFAAHVPNLVVLDADAAALAPLVDGLTGLRVLSTDDVDAQDAASFAPAVAPTLDDLAYILYTSGSTGVPKGVMLSHRNGAAFVSWAVDAVGVTADDHVSSLAPFHFDLSTFDLFAPALAGARVVLVPKTASVFPVELAKFVNREAITVWYSVPSMLALLAERGGLEPGALPTLREVLFAGEVFPTPHLHKIMTLLPHAEFWNLYGPTETNVCTAYRVASAPAADGPDIPIGAAIGGVDTIAVTEGGTIASDGEVGELFVAGPTVMQGYWGDAERTAQRLVTDPLGDGDSRPWYRTGDLVVEDDDGNYRFLGRRDNQVKSRGYRIELGDIETALHTHPAVRECAAVAVPDSMVTNTIQAWVVTTEVVEPRTLASYLNARIPPYMIPEKFRFLDALPRTSTDKVDRKGLTDRAIADP
jgi:amino acid adenylation domain-containing protein